MEPRPSRPTSWLLVGLLIGAAAHARPAHAQPGWSDVASIFDERCVVCHSGDRAPRGVVLTDHESALAGGERPVIVPGDPDASELVLRVRGESMPRMPLDGPPYLMDAQIATIEAWIAAGAPGPDAAAASGAGEAGGETEAAAAAPSEDAVAPEAEPGSYEAVGTILGRRCASCHAPGGALGAPPEGLVLTSWRTVLAGGERQVVVPGRPLASELYRRVAGLALPRMPLDGPPYLDDDEIASIRAWIERGAPDAEGSPAADPVGREVRLHGTLTGEAELDGLPLAVGAATRIEEGAGVGAYVEVRGVVGQDGSIRVERIRPR